MLLNGRYLVPLIITMSPVHGSSSTSARGKSIVFVVLCNASNDGRERELLCGPAIFGARSQPTMNNAAAAAAHTTDRRTMVHLLQQGTRFRSAGWELCSSTTCRVRVNR